MTRVAGRNGKSAASQANAAKKRTASPILTAGSINRLIIPIKILERLFVRGTRDMSF